ncbi:MutT/NUDIX family protein [Planococcus antarcticus DSM 14505]|uniref:MutT/NUDIX family protein n=1 Tax=Planococcus antarcticus DSM 14505 TaxID=1185653 RepID=A0A1C7DJC5_9BACL|nr:NUDIX domain-containing protein [Planococcus antarcticus]ANU11488.1 NUDIX hydrolase [Planococcus antarcticus DSM 14505]EIM05404.1 MutT/NUDIX family protein [Planococcus antarcticus DSM 14505]
MSIRNSAKAIIIKDSKILLTKNIDQEGHFYLFPGGGQDHGEVLSDTVKRECLEEIGENVKVKDLLHIREYIGKNHEHAHFDSHVHQIEYYFVCHISTEQNISSVPSNPDSHQVGIEWVPIQDLMDFRIYPKGIRKYIQEYKDKKRNTVYLGDIN